ncbi:MAG: response regulator transcription factor [Rhodobacterales bacterium]|nr:response regulator transcription factor [Rhodobacterales bacterium]
MGVYRQPLGGDNVTAKLLIADDHDLVRETLTCYITKNTGAQVAQSRTLDEALDRIREEGPFDLMLLDLTMPGMTMPHGLTRSIAANAPNPVAILTGTTSREIEYSSIMDGAAGFLSKSLAPDQLVTRIRSILEGNYTRVEDLEQSGDGAAGAGRKMPLLTQRERDVLKGLCEGKSNKEIANDLDVQVVTVKLHVKTLSRKLEARNRTHAAMLARELHLI